MYYSKTYIEYYNFCKQYKDYFAIVEAKKHNYILFIILFFYNQALFLSQ